MLQYWIYILSNLIDAVFSSIDAAFGNYINVDAVVVMASYSLVSALGTQVMQIGNKAYTVLQASAKSCLLLSFISSLIWGFAIASLSDYIPLLFDLTDTQHELMSQVLICYAILCPAEALGSMCGKYCIFKCYNKLQIISNIAMWLVLLRTDWLVVSLGFGCVGIVFASGLSWLLYFLALFIGTKFWTDPDRINFSSIRQAFRAGKDYAVSNIAQRFASLALGHFASTMGAAEYAIYSVAMSAVSDAGCLRNAYFNYCIVRLRNRSACKEQKAKRLFKQVGMLGFLLPACLAFLLVYISHGVVDLKSAIWGTALFFPALLVYPVYDMLNAFAISRGKTKHTLGIAVWALIARAALPFVLSLIVDLNIYLVVLCYFLDYLGRTLYMYIRLKLDKHNRNKRGA